MKDMLPLWSAHLDCPEETRIQLGKISAASIDRLLKDHKVTAGKKIRPPKPTSAVKALVEVRAKSWDTAETGWTEVDTIAHCGGNMGGDFIWTLTSVEISSGWTELRAVWNRGQHATLEGLESIWESQPFDLLGVDSDNGGEFLNHHLYDWLKKHGIEQTRSRPYFKNDQAYVEQKNHTHVRQFLGYDRLEHRELLDGLNDLLKLRGLWRNLFCVTMKQESKHREGSRQIRRHEKTGRTPAQRLIDSDEVQEGQKKNLRKLLADHNPFEMGKAISTLENRFWSHRDELYRQEREEERLALADASALRFCATLRSVRKGNQTQQTNNKKPSRYGVLIMRQRLRPTQHLSVCHIYEATGAVSVTVEPVNGALRSEDSWSPRSYQALDWNWRPGSPGRSGLRSWDSRFQVSMFPKAS